MPLNCPCLGQVCGVAVSSALFQSKLNSELHARIHTPDADEVRVTFHVSLWASANRDVTTGDQPYSTFDDAHWATCTRFTTCCEGFVCSLSPRGVFPRGVFDALGVHHSTSGQWPCRRSVCDNGLDDVFRFPKRHWSTVSGRRGTTCRTRLA